MTGERTACRRSAETPRPLLRDTRGICLTELMVSSLAGAIVLAAALDVFNLLHARTHDQYRAVAQQQDVRIGLEVFEQETRLAAAGAVLAAEIAEFEFQANIGGLRTVTTAAAAPGQAILSVQDGSGWGEGKTIEVCGAGECERHRLARAGQRYQLTLAQPLRKALPIGASVDIVNVVRYYAARDRQGAMKLMRIVDGGANALISDLEAVRFTYWDHHGHRAAAPAQVSRVVLHLNAQRRAHPIVREVSLRS